jgi:rRNA processing protein Krr1/Pno1
MSSSTSRVSKAFAIPSAKHGAMIGKGGATIKAIEAASGARVRMPGRDSSDPVVVEGTADQIAKAVLEIEKATGLSLQTAAAAAAPAPAAAKAAPAVAPLTSHKVKADAAKVSDGETKLFVPPSCFGELVGPGGATVRELESATGAKIKIPRPNDAEQAVRVSGKAEQVRAALKAIEHAIGFAPSTTPIVSKLVTVPAASIGRIIGPGGATLAQLERDSECNITMPRKGSSDSRVLIEGNEEDVAAAIKLMSALAGDDLSVDNSAEAARVFVDATLAKTAAPQVTPQEAASVALAIQKLWRIDDDARLEPGKELLLNVAATVAVHHTHDASSEPLFKSVAESAFASPTIRAFLKLLDNYDPSTSAADHLSANEKEETWAFLHAACQTPPMRYAFEWVKLNGGPATETAFKLALYQLWFTAFSRGGGVVSSSAFEHVFVGEIKDGSVSGFHNWIMFYHEERAKRVDFAGVVVPHRRGQPIEKPTGKEPVLSVKFSWHGEMKPVSTLLVGTTPEFELALYTIVFFSKKEEVDVELAGYDLSIIVHRLGSEKIGSAYFDLRQ